MAWGFPEAPEAGRQSSPLSPVIAREERYFLEVAGLDGSAAGVFVIVLIAQDRRSTVERVSVETKILRTQTFAQFFVGTQENDGLASSLDRKVGTVVGVEAQTSVVEVVASGDRRATTDDPALPEAKEEIRFLRGLADIDAVDKPGDGDDAGADVVIDSVVAKVQ